MGWEWGRRRELGGAARADRMRRGANRAREGWEDGEEGGLGRCLCGVRTGGQALGEAVAEAEQSGSAHDWMAFWTLVGANGVIGDTILYDGGRT